MIVFACAITSREKFDRWAGPGFERAREPDSELIVLENDGTLSAGYNRILDRVAGMSGVEALVLAHQDLEITNENFAGAVRACLRDPEVAIVGAAGARGVSSLSWWDPGPVIADYEWRFGDNGESVDMSEWDAFERATGVHEVDVVDGMLLVLAPWAIENLRFDEAIDPSAHGYDIDICLQARAAGKKVVVGVLGVAHHHDLVVMSDPTDWIEAHVRVARKWPERLIADRSDGDWEERALRAEAAAGAAKMARNELSLMRNEALRQAREAWDYAHSLEDRLREITESRFWKALAPLRAVRRRLKRSRGRAAA